MAIRLSKNSVIDVVALRAVIDVVSFVSLDFKSEPFKVFRSSNSIY